METIYRSQQGKEALLSSYESYLTELAVPFERTYVKTRYGATHVLESGPPNAQPLVILQGGNCLNPMTLSWFRPLLQEYRIIAPDTIGHPGRSSERRISAQDNSFAYWLADILTHYGLKRSAFIGPSYGGGLILRLAACMPERIACAILVNPAGMIAGPTGRMIRDVLVPLLGYRLFRSSASLNRIADAMAIGAIDDEESRVLGEILQYVKLERNMPKLVDTEELFYYRAPTLVLASSRDLFFPGEEVAKRAKEVIPNLAGSIVYEGGHFPPPQVKRRMNDDIQRFLAMFYHETYS
ncbi:pimeloyl-ACP methyl ester carboxylesterase [Paenibacillus phyllosphaerae]|uniref:Pimeloyl-ACP methyl ester carboxylesterase n=1 Tax=Paenibacillus phyllosphaerae TaxID=274593 RepID=A0A7W5B3U4_9BACL|nr:alpha/beta hydrolase [Paenibacillus phyllosphaerae]MBB3113446.1 pimeloyl-ACP methyl ester carboxylesterase [Paenibacillus phyllosphaerae]